MNAVFVPSSPRGTVQAPPSKSMAHRLLICAGLARGQSTVRGVAFSQDIEATLDGLEALGARISRNGDTVAVTGADPSLCKGGPVPCRESGSTLRFLIPLALTGSAPVTFTGSQTLFSRPLSVYAALAEEKGFFFAPASDRVTVRGPLRCGEYRVAGNVSSQFISGLLFALPLLAGESRLTLLPPVESRSYVDLTLSALKQFGVAAEENGLEFTAPGGQTYLPRDVTVEGDASNAAFLEALNLAGGRVTVTGLDERSLQGDRIYPALFAALDKGFCTVDLSDCPDLGPVLFAAAALRQGARFTGVRRLRWKESDRVGAMAAELEKCGVRVTAGEDEATVIPRALHAPDTPLDGHNDHRIVMALSVLLTRLGGTVRGAEAVRKSFPDFFERLKALHTEVTTDGMDL